MINNDRFGRLARELGERLQDVSHAPEELQKGVNQIVRGACDRLELVSREDFDILMEVLQRTRGRVEALEARVDALEAALVETPTPVDAAAADEPLSPAEDAGGGEASR